MKYLFDLIVLGILILSTFIGYKRGFIKVAFGLVSFILSIVLAILLYKPISNFIIEKTSLTSIIEQRIETRLGASSTTKEETNNIISTYYKNIKTTSVPIISNNISRTIVKAASMLLVFLVSNIILFFFRFSGDLIAKLPLIKQLNSLLGFIYGFLKGTILIYFAFAIIAILAPLIDINPLVSFINSTIISNIIYNNNLIFILFF